MICNAKVCKQSLQAEIAACKLEGVRYVRSKLARVDGQAVSGKLGVS